MKEVKLFKKINFGREKNILGVHLRSTVIKKQKIMLFSFSTNNV